MVKKRKNFKNVTIVTNMSDYSALRVRDFKRKNFKIQRTDVL